MLFFFFFPTLSVLSLLVVSCHAQTDHTDFRVGVILDHDSLIGRMGLTSLSLAHSDFYSFHKSYSTKLVLHVTDTRGQVIDAAATALSLIKDVEVDAIIGPQNSKQASFVMGLGDRANVPVISFSATSPAPHPPTSYFVRTAINDAAQVYAIAAIIKHFRWTQIILVYEESYYGNGIIYDLCKALEGVDARVSYRSIIPLSAVDEILLQELRKMKTMQTRIFVAHVSSSLASRLFPKAKQEGMMVEGYAWIVTSGLINLLHSLDSDVIEAMQGVLGVKPFVPRSKKFSSTAARWKKKFLNENPDIVQAAELNLYGLWAYDTLWALAMAAERVGVRQPPSSLQNTTGVFINSTNMFNTKMSQTGPKLVEAMSEVVFEGLGGKFNLVNGELEPSYFQMLNVVGKGEREVGIWTSHGVLNMKSVIFPGDTTVVPKSLKVPVSHKKLRIGVPAEPGFTQLIKVEEDPKTNASKFTGCYIEIFEAVMESLPYNVSYEYVLFQKADGSSAGSYDELAYQVFLKNYDVAVGDITITYKRLKYVDFALPFTEGGVSIIVPVTSDHSDNEWIFLKPLTKELWLTAIALFILTGVAMWILEHRFNNAYRGPPAQHAGMIFYFPFMALVFAQREKIVNNLARLVVVVWMFVVLILSSTYTASLSARLTVQRLKPAVTGVNELISKGYYVGCRKWSFIVDLLQDMGFDRFKIRTYEHPSDCDKALSKGSENGGISALFSVNPYTKLFMSNYCDKYTTIAPIYPTEGFAYVLPKGSPLIPYISRAVIELTENGRITEIEKKWMINLACNAPNDTAVSTSVSLQSFKTLFGITLGITSTCLVGFLVSYLYKNRDFVTRVLRSDATAWSKVIAIFKHFDGRDPESFREKEDDGETGGRDEEKSTRTASIERNEETNFRSNNAEPRIWWNTPI